MPKSIVFLKDNYYEAKIQLRPFNEEVFQYIEKEILTSKREVYVARIEELKTGIDIYVTSQKFARALGNRLKKRFRGGELKTTRKLHTMDKQKSKKVYRVTVLFRYDPEKET